MQLRIWHSYIGMLIAPATIFLAGTGLLQIYSLHEAHDGYTPPPLIEKLGKVHKDQVFALGHHKPPPRKGASSAKTAPDHPQGGGGHEDHHDDGPSPATFLLKAFFTFTALGLMGSTGTGIWMAFRQGLRRRAYAILLLLGVVIPFGLAALTG